MSTMARRTVQTLIGSYEAFKTNTLVFILKKDDTETGGGLSKSSFY